MLEPNKKQWKKTKEMRGKNQLSLEALKETNLTIFKTKYPCIVWTIQKANLSKLWTQNIVLLTIGDHIKQNIS